MFWEKRLSRWVETMQAQANLPLRLELWNGTHVDLGQQTQVTIKGPHVSALSYLIRPSLANLGQAYVEGKFDVDGRLQAVIDVAHALAARSLSPARTLGQILRPFTHTRKKDAAAIRYHYDVSNAFYQSFLDERMVYSCAYFEHGDEDLDTAQLKKIDHILTKIGLQPGESLLDIGCGWGALVIRAAQRFGAHCVGVTLSENQAKLARERVAAAGLCKLITIRLQDYRDVEGQFDRVTSVGMFEHVGLKNLPLYFKKINALLKDDGLAMNHGITTTFTDHRNAPLGGGEFIEKYVFPHGELPHIGHVLTTMQEGGLEALDVENMRRHYAQTCALWADNFERNTSHIRSLVDEKRYRIWRIYLAGCAHAFTHDWISLNQIVCGKAGRHAGALRKSRAYMYRQCHATEYASDAICR